MKKKYVFIMLISMFLMLISITGTVSAANHTVNPGDSIQSVINNASSNDTIIVNDNNGSAYTYTGNLIINKTLQLKAITGKNVTIRPSNLSSIVTVNPGVTVTISNLIFANGNYASGPGGAIYNRGNLTLINCTFRNNTAYWGGAICNDGNLTVTGSTFTGNTAIHDGGAINSNNVLNVNNCVFTNNVAQHVCGAIINWQGTMNVTGSGFTGNTAAMEGSTIGNYYGSANINFNRIVVSGNYGLYNANGGVVNATNNWWGSNTDPTTNSSNIRNNGGTVTYNPWLVLNLTANPTSTNGNSTVTADLTHNNAGNDTSSQGHLPDNIPINFNTNLGTVTSSAYTRNGKASATFNRGSSTSGTATVTATLNNQTKQTTVIIDMVSPTVSSTDPANNAVNVPTNKVIRVTFSEPVKAGSLWIEFKNNAGTAIPICTSVSGSVLTVTPVNSLAGGKYTLTLHTGSITDLAGNNLALCGFSFNVSNTVKNLNTNVTYSSIQSAVNAASSGNTIQVGTGIYTENVVITKRIILRPASGANVTIQALNPLYSVFEIYSGGTTINGFIIQGATNNSGILLYYANNCNITGNTIINNGNNGIWVYYSNSTLISGNYISNNSVGVLIHYSKNATVSVNNAESNGLNGIISYCSNNNNISGNNVTGNIEDGIFLYNSNSNSISGNNAENNGFNGIYIDTSNYNNISRNNVINNTFKGIYVDNSNYTNITRNNATNNIQIGIFLSNSNSNLISGNTVKNNGNETIYGGIVIGYSNNNNVSGNNVTNNTENGIFILFSDNNNVSGNNVTNNTVGIALENADDNTISMNNATGNNNGVYLYNSTGTSVSKNNATNNSITGIGLSYANNTNLFENNVTDNNQGILLGNLKNSTISGNKVTNNVQFGIYLEYTNSTSLSGNNVTGNSWGIYIYSSNSITVSGNNATTNNNDGIYLENVSNSTISGNKAANNDNGIYLDNSNSNILSGNNVENNVHNGIYLDHADDNCVSGSNAKNNGMNGIGLSYADGTTLLENNVVGSSQGIILDNSNGAVITKNNVTGNDKGICLYFSPATVNFNRIAGNNMFGLYSDYSSFVNATNNWWGTNTPTVSSSNVSDIYIVGGNVIYNPWIVLTVNSVYFMNGIFNITADLTHNNHGTDLSSLGHVPNGININFTTNYGTIVGNVNTINGKAVSQLTSTINGIANVTVNLDNQIISKIVSLFNIYNTITQKGFNSIQAAIDDTSTSDGDIIEVMSGTYRENVVVNKRLIIRVVPGGNVTVQALNPDLPVFTINTNGNGSTISGFVINGSTHSAGIFINSSANNTISGNIISNSSNGICLSKSIGNTISGNIISHNSNDGININRSYDNTVYSNTVSDNTWCGINIFDDSGHVNTLNFNRIVENGLYGLYVEEGLVNATDNWWGSNNNLTVSLSGPSDIAIECGTVTYNPWLVLNVTVNPANTSGNSTITADLTHNSNGADTSSGGHVPDDIPVNFTTTLGTLTSPGYTRNGKAILTFNSGTVTSGTATVTATVDNQTMQMNITIDAIAPTVNATLATGLYNITQYVNLTAYDAFDPNPVIYYTTDGSTPTISSTVYVGSILLTTTTTLKFMAVDFTGNKSPVGTKYYIFSPVGNLNTGLGYSSIQNAIDDILTVNGNVIVVANGTYLENIVLNKNLTITPYDGNVTIHAASPNSPIITINSGGSGSLISGFTLTGANGTSSSGIYLNNASNCTIMGNILTSNYYGLLLASSTNNTIWDNNLTGNLMGGIWFNSSDNNTIYSNAITNNSGHGIYLYNSGNTLVMANTIQNNLMNGIELNNSSNSTIYENTIIDNHQNGIKATSSSADINFNIITGNTFYGLYNMGNGTLNATNNWWGRNNPLVSSSSPSDINIAGGTVVYDPWLVLSLTGSMITVTHNSTSDCEITADLTQDNHGNDTSSSGTIPDGLPVNFTTTLGTINSTGTIRSGRATVTLTSSPSDGATTVAATVNNWQVSKAFHKSFSSIQSAVSDPLTIDGDVIFVTNGTYIENIVVNKNLTIISEGNVTVQALNSSNPVFTVNDCSDSLIYGFTITGATYSSAIYLNGVSNCYVLDNTIAGNGLNSTGDFGYGIFLNSTTNCTVSGNILQNNLGGIDLEYSNNTLLSENNITGSTCHGIYLFHSDNTAVSQNNLENNDLCGISSEYSNSFVITENDIKNNTCPGTSLYYSSGELHFNRIVGNGQYGLYSRGGTVNATNNWWGTNYPNLYASYRDIYVYSGTVLYNPWLVLTITPTSYKVSEGKIYESTITADLNHNSNGEYLSTITYVPDGIPVNFTTDNGTITNSSSTVKGEASATLVLNPNLQSGLTNVTANSDGQNVSTTVDRSANATILIASTAIDLSTDQPLSLSYILPLNESVSWVSVLWKSTSSEFGVFQNEVDLIVNGVVVLNRTVSNINYLYYKNSYSQKVWYNVNFLNWLFSESAASKMALQSIIEQNPQLQNLTGDDLEIGILNIIKENNGFTNSEMNMIANHRYFTDDIATYIKYPGDAAKKITVEDPDSNELIDLDFPGNPISRVSTMIYANGGYFHVDDPVNPTSLVYKYAGYEGVRSFAIVTTRITDDILQYWLDQKDRTDVNGTLLYPDGPMKAAYGTFLEALLMIKCHDMVADQAASQYNVSWTRTTPIIVSVFDDAYRTVLTLECSHRFGMDVIGDVSNITAFRYACSSAINPIEHMVGESLFPGGNSTSIVMGLGQMILNGEMVDLFMSNGYFVMKSANNTLFLVLDPETGILRDVMVVNSSLSGSWCYSDQQAEWAHDRCEELLNGSLTWLNSIGSISLMLGNVAYGEWLGELGLAGMELFAPISVVLAPIAFLEAINPYMIEQAENEGNFNVANWFQQSFVDRWKDVGYYILFQSGGWSDVLNEENAYIDENNKYLYAKRDEEWKGIYDSIWGNVNGVVDLFLSGGESTLSQLGDAYRKATNLFITINDNIDSGLNEIIELGKIVDDKQQRRNDKQQIMRIIKSKEEFEDNMKIVRDNGDDGDPLKQYKQLGLQLGLALAAHNYSQAIQVVVIGGLCAIGESIAETLNQKEKGNNQTNNTNNTGGSNGTP